MFIFLCFFGGLFVTIDASNSTTTEMIAREDEVMNLTCIERKATIDIISVMYGRGGSWFRCENEEQSTEFVKESCQNKSFCSIEVNDNNFRDECWFRERLRVLFDCVEGYMVTELQMINFTTTSSVKVRSINGTKTSNVVDKFGVTWKLQNALATTIGIAVGIILSSIVSLVVISVLARRVRLKLRQKDKVEEDNSSQAILIAAEGNKKAGMQNLYTDPDENRQSFNDVNKIPSDIEMQSQHMYSITNRAFNESDNSRDVFYSHTSTETYNCLHKTGNIDERTDTLMYDHIRENV